MNNKGPLDGITIIDCTTMVAGPLSTQILADQGAEIIKIEPIGGDLARMIGPILEPGISGSYINLGRNKRSIVLDLSQEQAQAVVHRLVADADVFICNSRPGVMASHQLDYSHLKAINPKLVYASITGFGEHGPMSKQRAYDPIIQAQSGLASLNPERSTQLLPQLICDKLTGVYMAQAVTAALLQAARSGQGDKVEVSLLSATLAFLATDALWPIATPGRQLDIVDTSQIYQAWPTRDRDIIVIILSDREFKDLCSILDLGDLILEPRFSNLIERLSHWAELKAIAAPQLAKLGSTEALNKLQQASIPCGPVNHIEELLQDPQISASELFSVRRHSSAGEYLEVAAAAKFSRNRSNAAVEPSQVGQHSREILQQAGHSEAEINTLFEQKIVY